jgi:hypothetical protein
MAGTGRALPATTPRLSISRSKLPSSPSPLGYCRSTTDVRLPCRSTVSRVTAEQTPPVNRRWPTMRLLRPIDAATQARVATEGRRRLNPASLQSPSVTRATLIVRARGETRFLTSPERGAVSAVTRDPPCQRQQRGGERSLHQAADQERGEAGGHGGGRPQLCCDRQPGHADTEDHQLAQEEQR